MKQWLTPEERQSYREGNMRTEWGSRSASNHYEWNFVDRHEAELFCRKWGHVLVAREVSEARVVSIRG